jgi:hypothetical protein
MSYRLTVDQRHLGDEGAVYIHGLGTFTNGVHEISDELEQNFRTVNTVEIGGIDMDSDSESFGVYVPKFVEGPPLEEAAKSMHGVTVTKDGAPPPKDKTPDGDPPSSGVGTSGGEE